MAKQLFVTIDKALIKISLLRLGFSKMAVTFLSVEKIINQEICDTFR